MRVREGATGRGRGAQVRLEHMLGCLRVLQGAATAAAPTRLEGRLFLSGAVEAASLHLLRHLGVTHILNATDVRPGEPPDCVVTCGGGAGRQPGSRRMAHPASSC